MHLWKSCQNWGPLFAHNCFFFETCYGLLLRRKTGTKAIQSQMLQFGGYRYEDSKYYFIKTRCALHILTSELKLNTSTKIGKLLFQFKLPIEEAIQYLYFMYFNSYFFRKSSLSQKIDAKAMGKMNLNPELTTLESQGFQKLLKSTDLNVTVDAKFSRILLSKVLFHSTSYQRKNSSNSHCSYNISFHCHIHNGKLIEKRLITTVFSETTCFGEVQHYLSKNHQDKSEAFAWIAHFKMQDSAKLQVFRFPFEDLLMIRIDSIISRVILTVADSNTAIVHQIIQYA